ncbi:MAG: hypothetical protein ACREF5_02195 [Candidatus Saccharimonadales bacterium]
MPTSVKKSKKTTPKKKHLIEPSAPAYDVLLSDKRRLRLPAYKPFRLKRIKHPVRLPSVWQLTQKTSILLWRHRWLFLGLALVYGLLNILLVRGFSSDANISSLKNQFSHDGQLTASISIFGSLLTSSGSSSNASAGAYQIFLGLIVSLATIWVLRQVIAGENIRFRDSFYKGMYPLIPFILVLMVVLIQTLPFLVGGGLYSLVVTNGIAVSVVEKLLWGLLFLALATTSVYMLCSSLFALYIVTLPDMTPIKALRSARQLVRYRRPAVFRKLLFLPVALLVLAAVIMFPFIVLTALIAPWILFVLTTCSLIIINVYMYTLYRELLQ